MSEHENLNNNGKKAQLRTLPFVEDFSSIQGVQKKTALFKKLITFYVFVLGYSNRLQQSIIACWHVQTIGNIPESNCRGGAVVFDCANAAGFLIRITPSHGAWNNSYFISHDVFTRRKRQHLLSSYLAFKQGLKQYSSCSHHTLARSMTQQLFTHSHQRDAACVARLSGNCQLHACAVASPIISLCFECPSGELAISLFPHKKTISHAVTCQLNCKWMNESARPSWNCRGNK